MLSGFAASRKNWKFLRRMIMKKMVFCIIPLIIIMGCASSSTQTATTNGASPGMDLDAAIKEAAAQMEANEMLYLC
jgi:uncharacterized protein YceK